MKTYDCYQDCMECDPTTRALCWVAPLLDKLDASKVGEDSLPPEETAKIPETWSKDRFVGTMPGFPLPPEPTGLALIAKLLLSARTDLVIHKNYAAATAGIGAALDQVAEMEAK